MLRAQSALHAGLFTSFEKLVSAEILQKREQENSRANFAPHFYPEFSLQSVQVYIQNKDNLMFCTLELEGMRKKRVKNDSFSCKMYSGTEGPRRRK